MRVISTILLVSMLTILCQHACCQNILEGTVIDDENGESLIFASVLIKGTTTGSETDFDGNFIIKTDLPLPITLFISYTGYDPIEYVYDESSDRPTIKMRTSSTTLTEIEVKGQRIDDVQKTAPLTVERMDALSIKEVASQSFYEGLGNMKGVDLTTASLGFTIINTRGFNSTSPVRVLQTIDGVDNQAPGLNFSLGNFLGASDLDVKSVDLVSGASGPFYGPNAFNGVIAIETKNPFIIKGLDVQIKAGERDMLQGAIRWADAINNKDSIPFLAYKFNIFGLKAYDWVADNYQPIDGSEVPITNPGGYDAVNRYGDERVFNETTSQPWSDYYGMGKYYRRGYEEEDLVDYNLENIKANLAVHIRTQPKKEYESPELILSSSLGTGTTVYQGDNRFSLRDILFMQNRLEYTKKGTFFIRAYATNEDAGNSYDPYFTALRLTELSKSDNNYRSDMIGFWNDAGYRARMKDLGYPELIYDPNTNMATFDLDSANIWLANYNDTLTNWLNILRDQSETSTGLTNIDWHPFYVPGTPEFQAEFDQITKTKSTEGGTRFFDKSALYHVHGEYIFTPTFVDKWTAGANYRLYRPNSEGTIFTDTLQYSVTMDGDTILGSYDRISNSEFGVYTGIENKFFENNLTVNATIRMDKNQNFNYLFTPALSGVYTPDNKNYFRLSASSAIRNPTLADQYLKFDVGPATLLGNLNGFDSLITIESLQDAISGSSVNIAALEYFSVAPIKPEEVISFEFGYRTTLLEALYLDAGYYFNSYTNFIGYNLGLTIDVLNQTNLDFRTLEVYRVSANAKSKVNTQGVNVGLNYYFLDYFQVNGNYSWNTLLKSDTADPIIPAFNTPEHKFNLGFSARDLPMFKHVKQGFNITYKWINEFLFEGSPQFTGTIPTYDLIDAQWNCTFTKLNTTLKIGASNLLNKKNFQTYGGPRIGRLAYISLNYNFIKK